MIAKDVFPLLLLLIASCAFVKGQEEMSPEEMTDPRLKSLNFETPQLSEEEQKSMFLTEDIKCDSCIALAFRIHRQFEKAQDKKRSDPNYNLPEYEILDATGK